MGRRNSLLAHVCALAVMISMTALSAEATFSNASLKGGYSFLTNRWTSNSNDDENGTVGVFNFDGAGNATASFRTLDAGTLHTGNATGTYTVNSNGTGTITLTGQNTVQFDIVVNSSKSGLALRIALLRVDANYPSDAVDAGTAVSQSPVAITYSLAKLKGNLCLQLNKWTPTPADPSSGLVAILTFNGTGGVKGSFTDKDNGAIQSGTVTGTYTINADGSGTMALTTSDGGTPQLSFVLNTVTSTAPAKGMQVLQTSGQGNQAFTGVALKQ